MYDDLQFETEIRPDPNELLAFYERQQHKITSSVSKLRRMIDNTFCFVTVRRQGELVGLARGVTDGVWGCLVECKLDPAFQGPACVTRKDGRVEHDSQGIAREMARLVIEKLRNFGTERIAAFAHGTEVDFCGELGFEKLAGVVAMELDEGTPVEVRALVSSGTAL